MKYSLQRVFLLLLIATLYQATPTYGQSCDTISNFMGNYSPAVISVPPPGWGYISGHNNFNHTAKADYYFNTGSNTHIDGAIFGFGYAYTVNPLSVVTATVWDGTGGTPGAVLVQKDIFIQDILAALMMLQPYYLQFDTPVELPASNQFFVGFTMTPGTDTVALVTNVPGNVPFGAGTAWERLPTGTWQNYNAATSWGFDAAHLIFPTLSSPPEAIFSPSNATGCIGSVVDFDGSFSENAATYEWLFPGGTPSSSTIANPQVTYSTSGTYDVSLIVSNGCISDTLTYTNAVDIVNYCPPTCNLVTIIQAEQPTCNGFNDGKVWTITSGGTGPYTYQWGTTPMQTTDTAFNVSAGTYNVTVTDANGCFVIADFTVGDPQAVVVNISKTDPTVCNGTDGTATASATGGTGVYTYLWNTTPAQTSATATGLGQGNYSVTVTDGNGCIAVGGVSISDGCNTCALTLSIAANNASCGQNNGTATANVSGQLGAVSYAWSSGATTQTISNLGPGTYSVTVSDVQGCTDSATVQIIQSGVINVTLQGQDNFCSNSAASIDAIPSGGAAPYTYAWSNGATTASINNLSSGSFTVTVTDANGCTSNSSIAVTSIANGPTLTATQTNVSCYGAADGTVNMSVNGGNLPYAIFWSPLNVSAQNLNSLDAGNYTAVVVDQAGCIATTTVVITEPDSLTIIGSSTPTTGTDGTATVNVAGGTPPFTFGWSTGSPAQTLTGLTAGTYNVTVTDANGCTNTSSVIVQQFTTNTNNIQTLNHFELFPNPNNGQFNVRLDFSERTDVQLEIFNLMGQSVYTYNGNDYQFQLPINLQSEGAGAYFIIVQTNKGRAVKRLIITN